MNDITPRKIKTGGDPRTLPDYTALRDELSKLTHPARPDVNWLYVEKRCLSLFEQNGVELQTAASYTLARTQLSGLSGLNEGLAILDVLISHQWEALWPQPVHARTEILSSLSQRLQQIVRILSLSNSDLSQLYQAEQLLTSLGEELQRQALKHLSQLDTLRTLVHNSAARLESSDRTSDAEATIPTGIVPNIMEMDDAGVSTGALAPGEVMKWVYVAQSEGQANAEVMAAMSTPVKKWKFFAAGMSTMLVISTAAIWGWQSLHQPDPLQAQLAASLASLPTTLTPEQLDVLRQQALLPKAVLIQTQQQIARLDKLPPDWNMTYSRKLIEQAQVLWPEQANALIQQWQQQINAPALPVDAINGWNEGMTQLQGLADKLNALDGQKGKYITVSELKSQVFGMMTSFRQSVPAEEHFRLLKQLPADSPLRQQHIRQAEQHIRAQIYTLAQEKYPE